MDDRKIADSPNGLEVEQRIIDLINNNAIPADIKLPFSVPDEFKPRNLIGQRIKDRRRESGLSLSGLAAESNVSKGYLSRLESGQNITPSVTLLDRIATALGLSINDLYESQPYLDTEYATASLREFAQLYHVPQTDVDMLSHIQYRGNRPVSIEDWWFIYEAIKRGVENPRNNGEP